MVPAAVSLRPQRGTGGWTAPCLPWTVSKCVTLAHVVCFANKEWLNSPPNSSFAYSSVASPSTQRSRESVVIIDQLEFYWSWVEF